MAADSGPSRLLWRAFPTLRTAVRTSSENERDRLLAAAVEVLDRSGWWGFKVESVLKAAGLSTRSFYRHFSKKTDLLLALLEMQMADAAVRVRRLTETATRPAEKVDAYVAGILDMAYIESLANRASLYSAHWRELLSDYPETIQQCTEQMIAPLAEALAEGAERGELSSDDPHADARTIFFLVASVTADYATMRGATARAQVEQILLPFIRRTIGRR